MPFLVLPTMSPKGLVHPSVCLLELPTSDQVTAAGADGVHGGSVGCIGTIETRMQELPRFTKHISSVQYRCSGTPWSAEG